MDKQILFFVVIALGSLTTRAELFRAGLGAELNLPAANFFTKMLGVLAGAAYISVIVWGLINLQWYIALGGFILVSSIFGMLINKSSVHSFLRIKPFIEILNIIISILIWTY